MKWSWKIGTFAGIGVYIHATFLLIIGWVFFLHWSQGDSLAGSIIGVIFILAIFVCVVLHEFGHALTARKFGIQTRDITLLPIGGVARLEKMPDDPKEELLVALAGPAVNVVIALALLIWLTVTTDFSLADLDLTKSGFLERLMVVNIFLGIFNLVPAFPMDGGRVLRAILAMKMSYPRATEIAATIGQGMAFLFGFIGLFGSPILLFIALFVWIGAYQESNMVQMKYVLSGIPVRKAMITHFEKLSPTDSLKKVIGLVLDGFQHDFPVVEDGHVIGILTQKDLMLALKADGDEALVKDYMHQSFQKSHPMEMLDKAFERLQQSDCYTMPVIQDDLMIGLLTNENVGELIMIQTALDHSHHQRELI